LFPDQADEAEFSLDFSFGTVVQFGDFAILVTHQPQKSHCTRLLVQHRDLPLQEQDRTIRGGTFLATQAEIINSPAVIRSALASVPPSSDYDGTDDERLQIVLASFGVTPVDRTNVLTLSHWSPVPEEAARILDATIESYRNFVRKTGRAESDALEILTRKEKELRKELSVAEDRYQAFRAEPQDSLCWLQCSRRIPLKVELP
jgi:hypothetical protein